jgi:hypothetical protein
MSLSFRWRRPLNRPLRKRHCEDACLRKTDLVLRSDFAVAGRLGEATVAIRDFRGTLGLPLTTVS